MDNWEIDIFAHYYEKTMPAIDEDLVEDSS
jgi:hypothetical protein